MAFAAVATDDGKPNIRNMPALLGGELHAPQSATGLRLSFYVYRGSDAAVRFDPPQVKVCGGHARWTWIALVGWIQDAADS